MNPTNWPVWAQDMALKIQSKTTSQFILYNNVRDLMALENPKFPGPMDYVAVGDFLAGSVFKERNTVLFYDISKGVYFQHRPG
ncbi:MAG TPA: hypothetical protein PLH27_16185 [bacterium]|nr:hypothetical protein [bacterium]